MARCICINDKNRPKEIGVDKWVKKDMPYTIIDIQVINKQNKILAVQLEEIDLDETNHPYYFFRLDRFMIPIDDWELFLTIFRASEEASKLISEIDLLEYV
jgi:hypothetical protein